MRKVKNNQRKEVKQYINRDGYSVIDLEDKYGKMHRGVRVDHLVFEAFVRPLRSDEDLAHKDGDKLNNAVDNLIVVRKK